MVDQSSNTDNAPSEECTCDVLKMCPERISFDLNTKYSHQCMDCKGGITEHMNTEYNRYWGFSGFDEYNDDLMEGDDFDD